MREKTIETKIINNPLNNGGKRRAKNAGNNGIIFINS
jgi:hypothetical protein